MVAPSLPEAAVPTHTRTVVFTDISGYTASVARSDREAIRNLIAAHEQMVRPVVEQYGGRVVKNIGDSFMALFPAATDAVRCGLALVEGVTGQRPFSIRAAMATGDVEEIDGDAFGEAVNLAARVLAKTPASEVWFTEGTQIVMNQAEIPWEPVGRFAFKGIAAERQVFRAVPAMRCWLPEAISQAARRNHLVRLTPDRQPPALAPAHVILLEGFEPGSPLLKQTLDALPVIDPARLWLAAYRIAPHDRLAWQDAGRGLLIGTGEAMEAAIQKQTQPATRPPGSETIILDAAQQTILEVAVTGLALPAVPLSQVVASYTYDLLADGRWVGRSDSAIARIEVTEGGVRLTAFGPGLQVAGKHTAPGQTVELRDGDVINAAPGTIRYREVTAHGYAGILLSDAPASLGIAPGQEVQIGREPRHPGLALPDRSGQDNIRWCVGSRAARARESGFTLDRALAGRRQAALRATPDCATVISLHERCPTFVMNGAGLHPVAASAPVAPGDYVIAGTSVVAVREPE
jgi:class 3 adenylate cyclase